MHSHNEWGRSSEVLIRVQLRVVVRNQQTHEEHGQDVEDDDTPDDLTDGGGNSLSWVGRLTTGDTNQLHTLEGEEGGDEGRQPGQESVSVQVADQALTQTPRTWVSPVPEAHRACLTSTADHAKSVDEPAHHGKNLDRSDPELKLTVVLDGEHVEGGDEHPEDGDPGGQWHGVGPELDNLAHDGHLQGESDGPGEPVVPAVGHTQSWGAEPGAELGEGSRAGNVGGHLTQALGDGPGQCGDEDVGNKRQHRPGLESVLGGDEETRTNGTTQGDHGDVSGLQVSLDLVLRYELQGVVTEVVDIFFHGPQGLFSVGHGEV